MSNSCPICFEELIGKSKASPDVCDHIFCLPCLEKWSKHGSYCPVDRKRFKKIISLDSETVIQVKPVKPKQPRVLYNVTVYCEVCKKHNNASTLLLCDCCDLGYHCKCLTPPLKEVPAGQWYCPVCTAVEVRINTAKGSTKKVQLMDEDHRQSKDLNDKSGSSGSSNLPDNQTSIAKNEVGIDKIPEPSLQKTAALTYSNNEKHKECYQSPQGIQKTDSTNQSCIEESFAFNQDQQTQKEDRLKKSNKKQQDFNGKTVNVKEVKSINAVNKQSIQDKKVKNAKKGSKSTDLCRKDDRKLRNGLRETLDFRDDYVVTQSSTESSIIREKLSSRKEIASTSISKDDNIKLNDCPIETIDNEDSSSAVQTGIMRKEKTIPEKQSSRKEIPSTSISKDDNITFKSCLIETIDNEDISSAVLTGIMRKEKTIPEKQSFRKEIASTSISKDNNKKLKACPKETIDNEDISSAVLTGIMGKEKTIESRKDLYVKVTGSTSMSWKNDKRLVDCLKETKDIGDGSPAIEKTLAICIQNKREKHRKKESTDLSKKVNRKRYSSIEIIEVEDDSTASLSNFSHNGVSCRNSQEQCCKTPNASTSQQKMHTPKLENVLGEILCVPGVSIAYQDTAERSNERSFNEVKRHSKMGFLLKSHPEKESSNVKNLHIGTTDNKSYLPEIKNDVVETENRADCAEVLSSCWTKTKREVEDKQKEATCFENDFSMCSVLSSNENSTHSSQNARKNNKTLNEVKEHKKMGALLKNHPKNDSLNLKNLNLGNAENKSYSAKNKNDVVKTESRVACAKIKREMIDKQREAADFKKNLSIWSIISSNENSTHSSQTARSSNKSFNEVKQHSKMEILLKCHPKKDSSNVKNLHKGTSEKRNSSLVNKKDAVKSERRVASAEVLSSRKTKVKRKMENKQKESTSFKNDFTMCSIISSNENSPHSSQKHSKELIEFKTIIKKKEKTSNYSFAGTEDTTDHESPTFQTNIAFNGKSVQKNREQNHQKKNAQTSVMKLKDSFILEPEENNSNIRVDSSASEQSYFSKKDVQNYSESTKLCFSSLEPKSESQRKSSNDWCLGKHERKASCNEIVKIGQQEVLTNNKPHLDGSSLNTALSCNDRISSKNFQPTKGPINNNCDINVSTKDNFDRNLISSHFSVFENVEDSFISSQKYLNINRAVGEKKHTTSDSFCKNFSQKSISLFSENSDFLLKSLNSHENLRKNSNLSDTASVRNSDFIPKPSQNYNIRQVNYAIKAKMDLAEELKKIEKEKWASSVKKRKHPRLFRSSILDKLRKDNFIFQSASISKQI